MSVRCLDTKISKDSKSEADRFGLFLFICIIKNY